jgi:hypothetical protein
LGVLVVRMQAVCLKREAEEVDEGGEELLPCST